MAVSSAGEVYISVEGTVRQRSAILAPNPGLQVYSPDGTFLRDVPNTPFGFQGFVIHKGRVRIRHEPRGLDRPSPNTGGGQV